jgi:hypothetical protein
MKYVCRRGPCDGVVIDIRDEATTVAVPVPNKPGQKARYSIHLPLGPGEPLLLYDPV